MTETNKTTELIQFFKDLSEKELPSAPITLPDNSVIVNVEKFIEGHTGVVSHYCETRVSEPYKVRLEWLKMIISK